MAKDRSIPTPETSGARFFFDGAVLDVPSVDRAVPDLPHSIFKSHSHFPRLGSDSDEDKATDNGATSANAATPKCPGDEPIAPPHQRDCVDLVAALREGDADIAQSGRHPPW